MVRPTSFRDVIELWPSKEEMAADVGASSAAVSKWWQRRSIPSEWWKALLATKVARSNGLRADVLADLAAEPAEAGGR